MLGKLVNGVLITPTEDEYKKIVIINPTEEQLKQVMDYKELVVDEKPECADNQYLVPVYEETDNTILGHWSVCIQEEEYNEIKKI